MKSRFRILLAAITFSAALAIPLGLTAQEQPLPQQKQQTQVHHHYKFIDIGALGGPHSYFSSAGFGAQVLKDHGTVAGTGDTPARDPYYPNCFELDCRLAHAFRWKKGRRTDLGALQGVNNSAITAMNALEQVAGFSENGVIDPFTQFPEFIAVLWKDDQIINLGTLGGNESLAIALNNQAQAVGIAANATPDNFSMFAWGTQTRAFVWENGVLRDLGTLGGPDSGPGPVIGNVNIVGTMCVNERGQVAGASYTNSIPDPILGVPTTDPFLWENGRLSDLGTLGGTVGVVTFLNNRGQVAGTSYIAGNVYSHPFLWSGGVLTDLGTLGGNYGATVWLNDAGDTVGWAALPGDQFSHATLWRRGMVTDLGTVDGDGCSEGLAVNSSRQIVGQSFPCDYSAARAFLWENGSMVDLNTLIPANSNRQLVFAANINDRGEIVGAGVPPGRPPNTDLYGRLFLLIPCDEDHPGVEGCDYSLVEAPAAVPQPIPAIRDASSRALPPSLQRLMSRYHFPGRAFGPKD